MILAGFIDVENSHLAIFKQEKGNLPAVAEQNLPSQEYSSLEKLVDDFFKKVNFKKEDINVACFGIAGPVVGGRGEMANIEKWPTITVQGLSDFLDCPAVDLLNDMVAMGYATPILPTDKLLDLNSSVSSQAGNATLIAAMGKGLGELLLYWDHDEFRPSPSEGGHTNFAPRNELEIELLRYLLGKGSRKVVSYEQLLSWPGLVNIYNFLKESKRGSKESSELRKRLMSTEDPATVITEIALANEDALCTQALDLFVSIYGAVAGDLALHYFAVGGVYLGGGIALEIKDKLSDGTFMQAFTEKEGKFAKFNADNMPVKVILEPDVVLLGAARRAKKMVGLE
jgi:glucokinase